MSNSLGPHGLWLASLLLSMRFFRQEYGSGLLFPSPGDLPNPGIKPSSLSLAGRLSSEPPVKAVKPLGFYYLAQEH